MLNWCERMIISEIDIYYFYLIFPRQSFFSFKESFAPKGEVGLDITENNLQTWL